MSDNRSFHELLRMNVATFEYVVEQVRPLIERQDTQFRKCIPVEERVAITLRFLATGNIFHCMGSMHFTYLSPLSYGINSLWH